MKKQKLLFLILLVPLMSACNISSIASRINSIFNLDSSSSNKYSSISSENKISSDTGTKSSNKSTDAQSSSHISSSKKSSSDISSSEKSSSISKPSISYGDNEYDLSQYYDGYYSNFSWTDSADLIKKLHDAMRKNFGSLSYGWDVNEIADVAIDDFEYIDVIYSEEHILKDKTTRTSSWNKEHAFCASLMCGVNTSTAVETVGRATDYHNLFASDSSANSSRGNTNYGEIPNKSSQYGYVNGTNSSGKAIFEPGEYDKGRVSRALFYMATMYSVDNEAPNPTLPKLSLKDELVVYPANGQGYTEYAHGNLSDLLEWSRNPVDRLEYQHNNAVCNAKINGSKQGNRNAYVDFPELVEYAFGDKKDQPGELKKITPSAELLNVNEEGIANYAIKKAKRFYQIGDPVNYSDIELVAVKNDFSNVPETNFTIKDVASGTVLSEGTHELTIVTDINEIKYEITVGNDYFATSTYSHTFTSQEIKKDVNFNAGDLNLNINWENDNAKVGSVDGNNNRGIQIGNSTYNCGDITILVNTSLTNISGIYFKCGVPSGNIGKVKFFVDENLIQEVTIRYVSGQASLAICNLDQVRSGKVKVVFNSGGKASYIHSLAINYAN